MPKIVIAVPETNESVTRPVILDITRQLFEITGLPTNTTIFYPGDLEKGAQNGSLIRPADEINTMPFNDRLSVEVEENYEADRILSTAVYRPENLFIFRDDRIETSIKPAYSSTDVTINFRYRAVDKVTATRWRDDMRIRTSMMRDERIHSVSYHYLIPPEFLIILKEIYRMREAVAGYGETYDEFFKANATQRASILTTLAGTQGAWGISETQMRIVGWFDFEGAPELGSKEDDADTWTVSFSYKFKYDKPVACVMMYPLMIHNQVMSAKFRPDKNVDTVDAHVKTYSLSAEAFAQFEKGRTPLGVPQGLAIPNFDEFIPGSVPSDTLRLFTALTDIDTTDPRTMLCMRQLGNAQLHPALLDFMIGEAPYVTKARQSIFVLSLYRNCDLMPAPSLTMNASLVVSSTVDLSLRNYHHIRLSIVKDLTTLSDAAIGRLRHHGHALQLLMNALDPSLNARGLLPDILGNDYVSKAEWDRAVAELNRSTISQGDHQIRQFNTVMTLFLEAYKETDYAYR